MKTKRLTNIFLNKKLCSAKDAWIYMKSVNFQEFRQDIVFLI